MTKKNDDLYLTHKLTYKRCFDFIGNIPGLIINNLQQGSRL